MKVIISRSRGLNISSSSCFIRWQGTITSIFALVLFTVVPPDVTASRYPVLAGTSSVQRSVSPIAYFVDSCNIPSFVDDDSVFCGCPDGSITESKIIQYCDPGDPTGDPKVFRVNYCIVRYPDNNPAFIYDYGWRCIVDDSSTRIAFNGWVKITGFCSNDPNFTLDSMQKYLFCALDMCRKNFFFPFGVPNYTGWTLTRSCLALSIPKCWEVLPPHSTDGICYISCDTEQCCDYWLQADRDGGTCIMQMIRYCTTEPEACAVENPVTGYPCIRLDCFDPCEIPWHCCLR
jgi:hypothetical protein